MLGEGAVETLNLENAIFTNLKLSIWNGLAHTLTSQAFFIIIIVIMFCIVSLFFVFFSEQIMKKIAVRI